MCLSVGFLHSRRRLETPHSWLRRAHAICGGRRLAQPQLGRRRQRRRGCLRHRRIEGTICTGRAAGTTAAKATRSCRPPQRRRAGGTRRTTRPHHHLCGTMRGPRRARRRRRPPQKATTDRAAARTTAPTLTTRRLSTRRRARTATGLFCDIVLDDRSFYDAEMMFRRVNERQYPCSDIGKWSPERPSPHVDLYFPERVPSYNSPQAWLLP